ncbi:hypothetical protein M441DRAFT_382041 [Trichoderma asperellum CBS 433.97]|uniref:Uncharacterized protein n=1 Tax=Trichoderma asperellum (strain ATCC 204424 / CBS 433.97 / NBRC 101777) TaxID=1042311 RepID=A0A2T3ZB95_TRIA4|nr:hypothetical protein M441DRAFT_382041 [Trichoderma asperellum CBS 433.97]PTB42066.1 hypothetical protein M441DRAFT_382041 [Trichoderma asperellum CBS 433.97]
MRTVAARTLSALASTSRISSAKRDLQHPIAQNCSPQPLSISAATALVAAEIVTLTSGRDLCYRTFDAPPMKSYMGILASWTIRNVP